MIYTCTVNPSLDYYLTLNEDIKLGEINRLENERFDAGGKGVNVSIVLNNLMIPSTTIGFLGGFTRDYFLTFFKNYPFIRPMFTQIDGHTRINIKISGRKETDLNAHGPKIKEEEFDRFLKRVDRIDEGDTFTLSGNVQDELFASMLDVLKGLERRNVRVVLDTNSHLLKAALELRPTLVKINLEDYEDVCGILIKSPEDIIRGAKMVCEAGAQNVIVSLGIDGAILVNEEGVYKTNSFDDSSYFTTGANDAMVGAYVFNMQRGADALEAFRYACGAYWATISFGHIAQRDEIENYSLKVKIEKE